MVIIQNSPEIVEEKDKSDCSIKKSGNGTSFQRSLTLSTCNPYILTFKDMEYACRGPVILRAIELEAQMRSGEVSKRFTTIIKANLGDAHAMGQKPLNYLRQVLSLITTPSLLENSPFPQDVQKKAKEILQQCRGASVGSYSDSRGMEIVRRAVAKFIDDRDGNVNSCHPDDVIICAGASEGIRSVLKLFKSPEGSEKRSGVMTPVPEYPLYSATLGEYNIHKISYFLDEDKDWGLTISDLEKAFKENEEVCKPRAIVVINPGNPTGAVLSRENIEAIIRFAFEKSLVILADEVYQQNIYDDAKFYSFSKVLGEMPSPYNKTELVSFYSCSKGYVCECGLRGAYFEMRNIDPDVKSILVATAAAKLCPTVLGQAAVLCSVDPPKPGDESHPDFISQRDEILSNYAERAAIMTQAFNSLPGVSCVSVKGAMYAYPRIEIPEKAKEAAEKKGQEPDVFYSLQLLEETGICVVPGSGVGQKPGTWHFRATILPSTPQLKEMMQKFSTFHLDFLKRYKS